ncbi:MAG: class I SAM-dependent methyltransferase [Nitrospirae bacterium]|nr:class I SAM-dependent methyltransferase [Nitrospirota bacterium]
MECGAIFLEDWDEKFLPELYDYYAERVGLEKDRLYHPLNDARYAELVDEIERLVLGRRILDVGCGQGQFVDFMVRRGWETLGVELSESAMTVCKQFALPVKKIDVFDSTLIKESFDLITLFEVIEHVPTPKQMVEQIEQLLKPGGVLYLTTPNFNSIDRRVLGASWHVVHREHIMYFTPNTLKNMLRRYTHFEVLRLHTQNLSIAAIREKIKGRLLNPSGVREGDQMLRQTIESSPAMRLLKLGTNSMLNILGWGSTITLLCRKPMQR